MKLKSIFINIYTKNILLVIVVGIVLIVAVFWWLNVYTRHGKSVTVPDVKGITVAEAAPFMEARGLRYEVIDSIYMKDKKPGVICEQVPQPESTVKLNRTIYLTVNSFSAKQIELPDVRDLSQRQAETVLETHGFTVSSEMVESEFRDLVLRVKQGNTVVYPGSKFLEGTRITLEVGDGALSMNPDTIPQNNDTPEISDDSWF